MKKTNKQFTIRKKTFRFLDLYSMFFSLLLVPAIGIYCLQALNSMTAISVSADYRKPEVEKVKEPTMQEWVMAEVRNAGLSEYEAWAIINTESHWNDQAIGVNNNKTVDLGIWQGNSIHIKSGATTAKCLLDYKCSTKWAIAKRLKDQNWSAWVGAQKMGIK